MTPDQIKQARINDLSLEQPGSATWLLLRHLDRPSAKLEDPTGLLFPLSFRLDPGNYFAIETMARISGRSKNYVAGLLLNAGVAWIVDHLSDSAADEYRDVMRQVVEELRRKSPEYQDYLNSVLAEEIKNES